MSILIKGMEMPTEEEIGKCIIVRHDGEVWAVDFDNLVDGGFVACFPTNPMRAVPVPPHGRLIDKDALEYDISHGVVFSGKLHNPEIIGANKIINRIHHAHTIIEAEEDEQ